MHDLKISSFLKLSVFLILFNFLQAQSNDTIRYESRLNSILIYETIELYPDKSFKWTSEYDLNFSLYGKYEISNNILTLNYIEESIDAKDINDQTLPYKMERYIFQENQLFKLNSRGRRIKRQFDKSIKSKWSCLFGHKYSILKV